MSWIPQGGDVSRDQEVSQDWMNAMVSSKEWFILTIENFGHLMVRMKHDAQIHHHGCLSI
jgi:hypothetical protein